MALAISNNSAVLSRAFARAESHEPLLISCPLKHRAAQSAIAAINNSASSDDSSFCQPITFTRTEFRSGSCFLNVLEGAAALTRDSYSGSEMRQRNEAGYFRVLLGMAIRAEHLYVQRVNRSRYIFASMFDMMAMQIFSATAFFAAPDFAHRIKCDAIFGMRSLGDSALPAGMLIPPKDRPQFSAALRAKEHLAPSIQRSLKWLFAVLADAAQKCNRSFWFRYSRALPRARNGASSRMRERTKKFLMANPTDEPHFSAVRVLSGAHCYE